MSGVITGITSVDATGLTTSTVAVPGGINAGDTLVIALILASVTGTVSAFPSGFSAITGNGVSESSGPSTLFLAAKTASGTESGTFVTTFSGTSTRIMSACLNVTGVGGGIDVSNAADNFSASTMGPFNVASGSTTTTGIGRFAVYLGFTLDAAVGQTLTFNAPAGFTIPAGGTYDSGAGRGFMIAYAEVPTVSTATYTGTISGTSLATRSAAGASVLCIENQLAFLPFTQTQWFVSDTIIQQ